MGKPFDNETVRTKTTWTDLELARDIDLLDAAELALRALGDRYQIALDDIVRQRQMLDSMAFARGWR